MTSIAQVCFLVTALIVSIALSQKSDEDKGYEFGFTIDGQQHRHEKKDEKGIIEGEFGFITADGIYHVTVYATDENGNFKILSMKNIRISAPLDGSPLTGPISPEAEKYLKKLPPGQRPPSPPALPAPPAPQAPQAPPPPAPLSLQPQHPPAQQLPQAPVTKAPYVFTTQPTVKPACAGCGYVTTPKPGSGNDFQFQNPAFQQPGQLPAQPNQPGQGSGLSGQNQGFAEPPTGQVFTGQQQQGGVIREGVPQSSPQGVPGPYGGAGLPVPPVGGGQPPIGGGQTPIGGSQSSIGGSQPSIGGGQPVTSDVQAPGFNPESPFGFNPNPLAVGQPNGASPPSKPVSALPPIQVVDNAIQVGGKNPQTIPIKDKYPGMQEGLPEGIEEKDIKDLLYKFHYTVGFHGHYEKGYKNGAKIGGYFVNGRDGISRVVTYVADENGYRPKFKFINLGLDSEDTPKEGSEKKFGLKSFEFVWYPIE